MAKPSLKRFDSINVIPLIDVMLVLLAITLVTASFVNKDALNIELPETEQTQSFQPSDPQTIIRIHIDAQNKIYLNEKLIALESFKNKILSFKSENEISLEVDKKANFGDFVAVIDLLKKQNLNNLTILTKSK
jgi:biopolymer transport protein ExbD